MATTTTNYGLTKPAPTDRIDVRVLNSDLDTVDTTLKTNADTIAAATVFQVSAAANDAAVDLPNINAQIALANAAGGVVQLKAGTYFIDGALTALSNGVTIRGAGPLATVIRSTSTTANMITSNGGQYIGVRDLQLESLVTRTAGAGIAFTSVAGCVIDNVRFLDTYELGTFTGCHHLWMTRVTVAHSSGVTHRGFWFQSCVEMHVAHTIIDGGTWVIPSDQAWFQVDSGCDTWTMTNCTAVASGGHGMALWFTHSLSPTSFAPRWVRVTNCFFESSDDGTAGANAIQIDDVLSAYFTDVGCYTSYNGVDIREGRDIKFCRLQTMNNWLRGALVNGSAGPIDVTFDDCVFDSNSQGLTNNVAHLQFGANTTGVRVRNTYFGQGILARSNKPNYAIENWAVAASDIQVSGCKFAAADYGTAILGGPQAAGMALRNNHGYNPVGVLGPPSVPSTTVAYTNAYGVDATVYVAGGTVTVIKVNAITTGMISGLFRVPAGGTITLTYSSAPTWVWIGD